METQTIKCPHIKEDEDWIICEACWKKKYQFDKDDLFGEAQENFCN